MLDLEPPDHTRLRRLVPKAFTPRTVEALRTADPGRSSTASIDACAAAARSTSSPTYRAAAGHRHRRAARHPRGGPPPAPAVVGRHLPDVRAEPVGRLGAQGGRTPASSSGPTCASCSRERRARPGDDLISALAAVVDDGDTADRGRAGRDCVLLLNAGHEASVNGAGNGWWTLFRHPGQLARLRADPALVPTAIEELLRFDTPLAAVRALGARGRSRSAASGCRAARRSPCSSRRRTAIRRPSRTRTARPRPRPEPVPLVRRRDPLLPRRAAGEARAADRVQTLLRRVPGIELVEEPQWKPTYVLRGLEALRVRALTGCATWRSATRTRSARRWTRPSGSRTSSWRALGARGTDLELVANLGVNGYTSADLIRDELPGARRRWRPSSSRC